MIQIKALGLAHRNPWRMTIRVAAAAALAAAILAAGAADANAQSACPPGYAYRHASRDCFSVRPPSCANGVHLSSDRTQCLPAHAEPYPSCPAGYTFRRPRGSPPQCVSMRPTSCPQGTQVNPVNGRCVHGAVPQ